MNAKQKNSANINRTRIGLGRRSEQRVLAYRQSFAANSGMYRTK